MGLFGVPVALLGAIWLVNGVAYLTGHGVRTTVYIEETRIESVPMPADPQTSVAPPSQPVKVGDGYYLDSSGKRHAYSVSGRDLKRGMTIHIQRPLVADPLTPPAYGSVNGTSLIVGGLIYASFGCFLLWVAGPHRSSRTH